MLSLTKISPLLMNVELGLPGADMVASAGIVVRLLPQLLRVLVTSVMVELAEPLDPFEDDTAVVEAKTDLEIVLFLPIDIKLVV